MCKFATIFKCGFDFGAEYIAKLKHFCVLAPNFRVRVTNVELA